MVGLEVDHFGEGSACAVAGAGIDADEDGRAVGGLAGLEAGGEFEGMGGDDAVVVIGGGDEGGGVADAGLELVVAR